MIKENELRNTDFPGFHWTGETAEMVSLDGVKSVFEQKNAELYNLPVEITFEQIKSGGLLNSKVEDCLIITNTYHRTGYFKYCIRLNKQTQINTARLTLSYYGYSKLGEEYAESEARKNGGLLGKAIGALKGFDNAAFEEEGMYYSFIEKTFEQAFGA